jgi:hypothetical protein
MEFYWSIMKKFRSFWLLKTSGRLRTNNVILYFKQIHLLSKKKTLSRDLKVSVCVCVCVCCFLAKFCTIVGYDTTPSAMRVERI